MAPSVKLDIVEPRIKNDRLNVVVTGKDWDLYQSTNVGIDPVTQTAFLLPLCYTDTWQTTTTGNYARLTKAEYNLTTPASWTQIDRAGLAGNAYLHSLNINEKVYTGSALTVNAPVYLSWYAYNAGNSRFVQMWCGWGEGTDAEVTLKVWSDNSVEVYRNGAFVGTGNLTDNTYYPTTQGDRRGADAGQGRQNAQRTVDMVVIPTRISELLVLSPTEGGGFNHAFGDVDPDNGDYITGAGPFWWYVPAGQATVQLQAPMRYNTSGTVYSVVSYLRYPPPVGAVSDISIFYNLAAFGTSTYAATITNESGGAFTPNGVDSTIRLKLALSGDGVASPYVYAGVASYEGSAQNTAAGTVDITSYLLHKDPPRLDVGEDPSSVTFTMNCKLPDALGTAVPLVKTLGNRPFAAYQGTASVAIITGRTNAPSYVQGISDEVSALQIECRDRWKTFENYLINDPEPLDGYNLGEAFSYFVQLCGYSASEIDIEYMDFELPVVAAASKGEFALIPEVGDTAAHWIQRLYEDFAKNMYVGWRPTATGPKFCVYGTATLGTAASLTLYDTVAGAGGTASRVYRTFKETTLEPEANDIYAIGLNKRTQLPIVAHYADIDSQDPTTAIASRPDNWLGERRKYSLTAPEIVTQAAANWAVGVLAERLAVSRRMAEWTCDFLLKTDGSPIWRGDVVALNGKGRYRINTLSASFPNEWDGTVNLFQPCTYTAERIGS